MNEITTTAAGRGHGNHSCYLRRLVIGVVGAMRAPMRGARAAAGMIASATSTDISTRKFSGKGIQIRKILAITALSLAAFAGVAACSTSIRTPQSTTTQQAPTTTQQQQTTQQQTTTTQQQQQQQPTQPSPSPQQVAQFVADVAVGHGALGALEGSDGEATAANCDPSTVSNPPDVSIPTSASCDITYLDGSIWQQTVTITFDNQGNPVDASTNVGTELSQPTGG